MKSEVRFEPHLVLRETVLPAGAEWSPDFPGWTLAQLSAGIAYWVHPRATQELAAKSVLVLGPQTQGRLRASQLGEARLHHFSVEPTRLAGLLTFGEQVFFRGAPTTETHSFRFLPPEDA